MQVIKPTVEIKGDSADNIMARAGEIVGFSKSLVVWRFGFLPGSDSAKAFSVAADQFHWVLADFKGESIETFDGFGIELPEDFRRVIDWRPC